MAKVLFVGNGINNIGEAAPYTWGDLIRDLIAFAATSSGNSAVRKIEVSPDKPFHLLYEEIIAKSCCSPALTEAQVKDFIAAQVGLLEMNKIYAQIADMRLSNIVTTNYENLLVRARGGAVDVENEGVIQESTYGIFRHRRVSATKIWYIHGYAELPRTILLGYEQYAGMLQRMRNYVVTGADYKAFQHAGLRTRLNRSDFVAYSWIDSFFIDEVHILGFTLDYVEMDIWWLLTYRSRMISASTASKARSSFRPRNKILYYIPEHLMAKAATKLQLLDAVGVEIVSLKMGSDPEGYYGRALAKIDK